MNRTKNLIIGGALVAGLAAVTAGCSSSSHTSAAASAPAKRQAQAPSAAGGSQQCGKVEDAIKNGLSVKEEDVFSCENDESNALKSGGETRTCKLVNAQDQAWRAKNLSQSLQDQCKSEAKSAKPATN